MWNGMVEWNGGMRCIGSVFVMWPSTRLYTRVSAKTCSRDVGMVDLKSNTILVVGLSISYVTFACLLLFEVLFCNNIIKLRF